MSESNEKKKLGKVKRIVLMLVSTVLIITTFLSVFIFVEDSRDSPHGCYQEPDGNRRSI